MELQGWWGNLAAQLCLGYSVIHIHYSVALGSAYLLDVFCLS